MKITPLSLNNFKTTRYNASPITFKGFDCPEDSFEIKRVYNLPCPTCSSLMIQPNQKDAFVAECQNATGNDLIDLLSKYKKYFHETELKIVNTLIYEATKYPQADILQLSQKYIENSLAQMEAEQMDALSRISKLVSGKGNVPRQTNIEAIIEKYLYIIQNEKSRFNKNDFYDEINNTLSNNHYAKKKILQLIKKMPTVRDEEIEFLMKYGTKSKSELASKLLTPSLATCEHIVPKSAGGKNNTENYLAQCQECNSKRNDTPFSKWVLGISNFQESFKKYINLVTAKIESGEISDSYIDYPNDITKTVANETNGRIKINPPTLQLTKDAVKLNFEAKITQLKKMLKNMEKEIEEAKQLQTKSENSEQFRMYLEYIELENEKNALNSQNQALKETQGRLKKTINGYYNSKISLRQIQQDASQATNLKDTEKTKNKILSLQKQINAVKIEEKEAEYEETNAQITKTTQRLLEIEEKLSSLESKINFPAKYQKEISEVKTEIFELSQLEDSIREKKEVSLEKEQLAKEAVEKESEMRKILEINAGLNSNDEDGNNIDEYNKMNYLISRTINLKDKIQKLAGKEFLDIDSMIFEFARAKAQEKMEELSKHSEAVQHHINLEKVKVLTEELNKIYAQIENLKVREKEFEAIQAKIDSMKSMDELNQELAILNEKLAEAKEIASSVDIEERIITLEKEYERKSAILRKIENKEMSEEDFIRIFSEV